MKIELISATETLKLRSEVLRAGRPVSECVFEGDHALDTYHFAALNRQGDIVGIVSAFHRGIAAQDKHSYQIRAMAVSPGNRKQGVGRLLLASAEAHVNALGSQWVWANARTSALGFYTRQGYQVISDEFVIADVGPHYRVLKALAGNEARG